MYCIRIQTLSYDICLFKTLVLQDGEKGEEGEGEGEGVVS
jgi:hypothetical protein